MGQNGGAARKSNTHLSEEDIFVLCEDTKI